MRNNENNIIFNVRNITLNLKNITTYFTGKAKIITLVSVIIMLSFINITLCLSNVFYNSNVSALAYQTSTNIGFTFLPTLNVSLSSNNLTINNLVPGGNAEDSNTITINVSTNIAESYNLYATVGNSANETTSLTNVSNSNYTFDSLSSNMPNLSSFANNDWGYSYSLDSGTTWISGDYDNASNGYNGLPLYTDTGIKLVEEVDNTSSTVDFKIAAKAGPTQPSGAYTNTINFTAVSNVIPTSLLDAFIAHNASMYNGYFAMQDMTSEICKSVDVEESELQLIDLRDNKLYWVAKLKDGNCWMTQNLDLEGNTKLSPSDTDFTDTYTLPTTNGWTTTEGKLVLPTSATDGFATDNYAYVYNSHNTTNCGSSNQNTPCFSYYSWDAATVGSGRNLNMVNADAPHSICPKGWKLPTARTTTAPNWQTESNFYTLAHQYGLDSDISTSEDDGEFYVQAGPGTISNFLLAGVYYYGSFVGIGSGNYWSSSSNGVRAFGLSFNINGVSTTTNNIRRYGCSVRCLAR